MGQLRFTPKWLSSGIQRRATTETPCTSLARSGLWERKKDERVSDTSNDVYKQTLIRSVQHLCLSLDLHQTSDGAKTELVSPTSGSSLIAHAFRDGRTNRVRFRRGFSSKMRLLHVIQGEKKNHPGKIPPRHKARPFSTDSSCANH